MFGSALFLFVNLATFAFSAPLLEERQAAISTLSAAQVASYKPYTQYAAIATCEPAHTLAWNCGSRCDFNSGFKPIASGGNGATVQCWYVGYDPNLTGTDSSKILPIVTNLKFNFEPLRPALFPGVSSAIQTHNGFGDAHAASATAVLAAVRKGLAQYPTTKVTVTGHSLGGAIAIIATAYLSLNLPSNTTLRTITYSNPRVGNPAFVNFVNGLSEMNRLNYQDDIVPIVPGRFQGYAHTEGEIHVVNSGAWINCPGQDNTDPQCTIGYVPNVLAGDLSDHAGPFDGVTFGSC